MDDVEVHEKQNRQGNWELKRRIEEVAIEPGAPELGRTLIAAGTRREMRRKRYEQTGQDQRHAREIKKSSDIR
jgi:hypothetical protein